MRSWEDFEKQVKDQLGKDNDTLIVISDIISQIILKRIEHGWSQAELASRAGVKQSAIARLESFLVVPRLDTLVNVVRALDLELTVREKGFTVESKKPVKYVFLESLISFFEELVGSRLPPAEQEFAPVLSFENPDYEEQAQYPLTTLGEVA